MPAALVGSNDNVTLSGTDANIPAISGYTPQVGDFIYLFGNVNSQTVTVATPADWAYGPSTPSVATAANLSFILAHKITAAEATAGTTSWTVTCFPGGGAAGRGGVIAVRGADQNTPTDQAVTKTGASTSISFNSATPTIDGCLVFAFMAPDNLGQSITLGTWTGWTLQMRRHNVANVTSWALLSRDALGSAGVAITDASTATLGSSDEWVGTLLVIAPPRTNSGGFFAVM